ncbi:MAG: pyridoxamine 5'-phosphate oxidase family protein, partial [Prevotellaceae bacterium]|nr:pyridoxamine 5'-phosphate oxidase family protein [Prevotellaceae bacterium]
MEKIVFGEVLDFLKTNRVFFLATLDGDQPRVRPFGIMIDLNGKLSFCTSREKDVFKQMDAHKKVEICSVSSDGAVLRLTGNVSFSNSREGQTKMFETRPELAKLYAGKEDKFVICTFENASATYQK